MALHAVATTVAVSVVALAVVLRAVAATTVASVMAAASRVVTIVALVAVLPAATPMVLAASRALVMAVKAVSHRAQMQAHRVATSRPASPRSPSLQALVAASLSCPTMHASARPVLPVDGRG